MTPKSATGARASQRSGLSPPWTNRRRAWPPIVTISIAVLVALLLAAAVAPQIASFDLREQDLQSRLLPPTVFGGVPEHPLGTDHLGRDVLTRLLFGLRTTLGIAVVGTLVGMLLGCAAGLAAGFMGGHVDDVLMLIVDVQVSVPFVLVALTTISLVGSSVPVLVLVVGLAGWEVYARVVRSQVLALKEAPYVEAARALGATGRHLTFRYLLPGVTSTIIVMATVNFTHVMLLESALSFLGVGVRPPNTSLGAMLGASRDYLLTDWTLPAAPTLLIVMISIAVSAIGDWLTEDLDPRL